MKSLLAITITWTILQSSIWAANTFTLDLANPTKTKYSTFLANIRTTVKDPKLIYGGTTIPVIGEPKNTFLRTDLKASTGTVSLGLLSNDLYVIAYLVKNDNNKFRVYYFKRPIITSAKLDTLFPEAKGAANQQEITEYSENYGTIEKVARMSRKEAGLGIGKLVTFIGGVNLKTRNVRDEARFMLVAIQMVSEATRFGYIEKLVLDNFPNGFGLDDKVPVLENNWGKISKAVKGSKKGVFETPLVLDPKSAWIVKNAGELNLGILKYEGANVESELRFNADSDEL